MMNSQMKKTAAAAAAVLMACSVFAGCGEKTTDNTDSTTTAATTKAADANADNGDTAAGETTAAAAEANTDLSGTIKVLHHRTDRDQDGTMAKLTEGFNAIYPNVTVEYQSFTNYVDDIATMLQSDNYEVQFVCSEYSSATDECNAQLDAIQMIVKKYSPESMVIGEAPLMKDLQDTTNVDLQRVNILSMAAIFLIILFVFKSISLPFI